MSAEEQTFRSADSFYNRLKGNIAREQVLEAIDEDERDVRAAKYQKVIHEAVRILLLTKKYRLSGMVERKESALHALYLFVFTSDVYKNWKKGVKSSQEAGVASSKISETYKAMVDELRATQGAEIEALLSEVLKEVEAWHEPTESAL